MEDYKKFNSTYLTGGLRTILIIPLEIATKHGLDDPLGVLVEETENGVLIRKKI